MAQDLGQIDLVIKGDSRTAGGVRDAGIGVTRGVGRTAAAGGAAGGVAGALKSGAAIPLLVLGLATAGLTAVFKKLKKAVQDTRVEHERLSRVNAALAISLARSRIGQIRRDITRGQILAPPMVEAERLREQRRNMLAPLRNVLSLGKAIVTLGIEKILNAFATGLAVATTAALIFGKGLMNSIIDLLKVTQAIVQWVPFIGPGAGSGIDKLITIAENSRKGIEDMLDAMRRSNDDQLSADHNRQMTQWIDDLAGGGVIWPVGAP